MSLPCVYLPLDSDSELMRCIEHRVSHERDEHAPDDPCQKHTPFLMFIHGPTEWPPCILDKEATAPRTNSAIALLTSKMGHLRPYRLDILSAHGPKHYILRTHSQLYFCRSHNLASHIPFLVSTPILYSPLHYLFE